MRYETQVQRRRRNQQLRDRLKATAITTFAIIGVMYIVASCYVEF